MTYELKGRKPASEVGELFRECEFTWSALVDVIRRFAGAECPKHAAWRGDGSGLNAKECKGLATVLRRRMDEGAILDYIATSYQKPEEDLYLPIGSLRDFVMFLEDCGGFHIFRTQR